MFTKLFKDLLNSCTSKNLTTHPENDIVDPAIEKIHIAE
ncbi:hypothetical protein EZBTHKR_2772 [Elizabethkingia anophelis]|uniref:Uncharacterized protein n=1 Tax=Elizabethkingia anophelis TaxID=1117645 RepID=A0A455ZFV7_9FLAO|nr:hypothetical protein EZBTHKR_2772 [Elizabethkingia anophelis]DAC75555.1 TPA_exp: hypothetical protein [Elizabethkingia anophelis]DAC76327.1 TPA_exp: hypothetical protein [Elizabethkingia anophelis]